VPRFSYEEFYEILPLVSGELGCISVGAAMTSTPFATTNFNYGARHVDWKASAIRALQVKEYARERASGGC